mmetsp:Transcript_124107/g.225434  ORF Transcript_124107/g.225434 Transcript_124107/m.225434 type:complete len:122 (+) Transcript_124107:344-709(+)
MPPLAEAAAGLAAAGLRGTCSTFVPMVLDRHGFLLFDKPCSTSSFLLRSRFEKAGPGRVSALLESALKTGPAPAAGECAARNIPAQQLSLHEAGPCLLAACPRPKNTWGEQGLGYAVPHPP